MWILGGWSKNNGNYGDVWNSRDGKNWLQLKTKNTWTPRHEQSALVFHDKIFVLGGMTPPLVDEVWSLYIPKVKLDKPKQEVALTLSLTDLRQESQEGRKL